MAVLTASSQSVAQSAQQRCLPPAPPVLLAAAALAPGLHAGVAAAAPHLAAPAARGTAPALALCSRWRRAAGWRPGRHLLQPALALPRWWWRAAAQRAVLPAFCCASQPSGCDPGRVDGSAEPAGAAQCQRGRHERRLRAAAQAVHGAVVARMRSPSFASMIEVPPTIAAPWAGAGGTGRASAVVFGECRAQCGLPAAQLIADEGR